MIATGIYPANSFLPPERQLALDFKTSRNTILSALDILADEGYIEKSRGRGTRILPRDMDIRSIPVALIHSIPMRDVSRGLEGFFLMQGMQDTLANLGFTYHMVHDVGPDICSADSIVERFKAAVFLEDQDRELIQALQERQFPVTVANIESDLQVSGTWVDHRKYTIQAVDLLVGLGHRKISFISPEPKMCFFGKSRDGYLTGLKNAGIEPEDSYIIEIEHPTALDAYIATQKLLSSPYPPTAIIAARDIIAEGVCKAASEAGLAVGRDISVIGFDDVSWPEEEPWLTTFREPCYQLGAVAVEMLVERIVSDGPALEQRELMPTLMIRRSAGPCM
jgi:DNA-binding LacI/PurR family transcriptional regulator